MVRGFLGSCLSEDPRYSKALSFSLVLQGAPQPSLVTLMLHCNAYPFHGVLFTITKCTRAARTKEPSSKIPEPVGPPHSQART